MIGAGITKALRKQIYRRDGWACALCGRADGLQIHHVVPRGKGGSDEESNLIALCPQCHQLAHGERPIYLGYDYLRAQGYTPEYMEQLMVEYLSDHYAETFRVWTPEGLVPMDRMTDSEFLAWLQRQSDLEWIRTRFGRGG